MNTKLNVINKNRKMVKEKVESFSLVKVRNDIIMISLMLLVIVVFGLINIVVNSSLFNIARGNENLRTELKILEKETSRLEVMKTDLENIREIQAKSEGMGFIYNQKIEYIK